MAIDRLQRYARIGNGLSVGSRKGQHAGKPHGRHEPFAADIADGKQGRFAEVAKAEEVSGEMAHGKDLGSYLELSATQHARTAEATLHLRGLKELAVKRRGFKTHGSEP
jgi:hypothetical protein